MDNKSIKTSIFWIIFIIAFFALILPLLGYYSVIFDPGFARLTNDPIFSFGGISYANNYVNNEDKWELRLDEPNKFLQGVDKIYLASNDYFHPKLFRDDSILIEIELHDDKAFITEISAIIDNNWYSYKSGPGGNTCDSKQLFNDFLSDKSLNIETVFLNNMVQQGIKKMLMDVNISSIKATLYPTPIIDCIDGEPKLSELEPKKLLIEDIRISIGSPVIYEWSTKGGTTYKL